MGRDYGAPGGDLGAMTVYMYGRPGASWRQISERRNCSDLARHEGPRHTIDSGGESDDGGFGYGATDCALGTLGLWDVRIEVTDRGQVFELPSFDVIYHNSDCPSNRRTCAAAENFCW